MDNYLRYAGTFSAINSDLDFMKRLRISRLFTWLQDVAGLHVEEMGVGIDNLHVKHGIAWIIMRMRVEIARLPALYEEVTVETWPLQPRGVFDRDFRITDGNGNAIVRAASVWVLMDLNSRNLIKENQAPFKYDNCTDKRAIDCRLAQLRAPGELTAIYDRTVRYSDADYNSHTNNTRYLDYAMDCMDMDFHRHHQVRSVEINFVNESVPGDSITLCKAQAAGSSEEPVIYIEGKNARSGKTIFKTNTEYIRI